jgi:RNA polymerase-binding transcription factor
MKNLISTYEYEKLLLDRRNVVLSDLGIKPELDRATVVADEDRAQVSYDEFVSMRLNNLGSVQLRLVNEALDRLRTGDFGVCLQCEDPIPNKRLHAVPWAKYCVACQQQIGG